MMVKSFTGLQTATGNNFTIRPFQSLMQCATYLQHLLRRWMHSPVQFWTLRFQDTNGWAGGATKAGAGPEQVL